MTKDIFQRPAPSNHLPLITTHLPYPTNLLNHESVKRLFHWLGQNAYDPIDLQKLWTSHSGPSPWHSSLQWTAVVQIIVLWYWLTLATWEECRSNIQVVIRAWFAGKRCFCASQRRCYVYPCRSDTGDCHLGRQMWMSLWLSIGWKEGKTVVPLTDYQCLKQYHPWSDFS